MTQALEELKTLVRSASTDDITAYLATVVDPAHLHAFNEAVTAVEQETVQALWKVDPLDFVEGRLGMTVWSMQAEIIEALRDHDLIAIPSTNASGKSHILSALAAHWVESHPVGTARVLTTSRTFRQVRNILWQSLRALISRAGLEGRTNQVEWFKPTGYGRVEWLCAYGFSASDADPEAVKGEHVPSTLVLIDEAGGMSHTLGEAFRTLASSGDEGDVKIVAFGNPPIDAEGSWFEQIVESGNWHVIRIAAKDTPNVTECAACRTLNDAAGMLCRACQAKLADPEPVPQCKTCPSSIPPHLVSKHLLSWKRVLEIEEEHGRESPVYVAIVEAQFPKGVASKAIPYTWILDAADTDPVEAAASGVIQFGVDVAADGGDEFAIARWDGLSARIVHALSGPSNENAVDVAGVVADHVRQAEADAVTRGLDPKRQPIRVKVDSIGVGWGVVGILKAWASEGIIGHSFPVTVVAVDVGRKAQDEERYANQKAEMWWTLRKALQPSKEHDEEQGREVTVPTSIHLDVDERTRKQLNAPKYGSDTRNRTTIESKVSIRRRGGTSPDRAEALLLGFYQPPRKRGVRVLTTLN